MKKPRLRSLYPWHSLIRELHLEGTNPKVIVSILQSAGCTVTANSIRRYAKNWHQRGWRTAEELGIQRAQLGLELLQNPGAKPRGVLASSTTANLNHSGEKASSDSEVDLIIETAPDPLSENQNSDEPFAKPAEAREPHSRRVGLGAKILLLNQKSS